MADETFYRILFVALYALFFSVRGYYRFAKPRLTEQGEVEERKEFGKAEALMSFAILGYFASIILYILNLPWLEWSQILTYPESVRWVGVVIALANIPLLGWIHRTLDRQYSACLQIKESHSLITEGPYSRVRHPMYTVLNGFSFGISLVTANILAIGFAILVAIPFPFVARKEEQMMIETFGGEYEEYMKRTGRFFPRI
ncbi:MAG: isoprenylcysteine carboxylmethyltransferase family protein [Candidatus Thorarchaeota archaeon]